MGKGVEVAIVMDGVSRGLTQSQIAREANMSQAKVSRLYRSQLVNPSTKAGPLPAIHNATVKVAKGQSLVSAAHECGCSVNSLKSHIFRQYGGVIALRISFALDLIKLKELTT